MAPRPFPYPLGVGIDICQVHRVAGFLRREELRNRWARKVFTRLEWPEVCKSFQRAQRANTDQRGNTIRKDPKAYQRGENELEDEDVGAGTSLWMLPSLSNYSKLLDDPNNNNYMTAISNERSPLGTLARHLAGRWAAKEAAIKAHSHRRLFMQDISIVNPRLTPVMYSAAHAQRYKNIALIDPVCNTILMDERVAQIRALRGFGPRSQALHKGALVANSEVDESMQHLSKDGLQEQRYHERRSKVKESDRQIAEINISHDGNFAVAVCLALDQPDLESKNERVVDYGDWLPIHEPQWGDEGWFSKDKLSDDDESGGAESSEAETTKQAIRELFEGAEGRIPFLR